VTSSKIVKQKHSMIMVKNDVLSEEHLPLTRTDHVQFHPLSKKSKIFSLYYVKL